MDSDIHKEKCDLGTSFPHKYVKGWGFLNLICGERRETPTMMTLDERRSGLILDDHPLWLEALELSLIHI